MRLSPSPEESARSASVTSRRYRISIFPALILAALLASCTEEAPEREVEVGGTEDSEGLSVESPAYGIYQMFQASGIEAQIGPEVRKPYFDADARVLVVNGKPVQVYTFDSDDDVNEAVASIGSDGHQVGGEQVTPAAATHFYRIGKVILLYVGDDPSVTATIETVVAPQFAGGPPIDAKNARK